MIRTSLVQCTFRVGTLSCDTSGRESTPRRPFWKRCPLEDLVSDGKNIPKTFLRRCAAFLPSPMSCSSLRVPQVLTAFLHCSGNTGSSGRPLANAQRISTVSNLSHSFRNSATFAILSSPCRTKVKCPAIRLPGGLRRPAARKAHRQEAHRPLRQKTTDHGHNLK